LVGDVSLAAGAAGTGDLATGRADLVGGLAQHLATGQALAAHRTPSIDAAIDPQHRFEHLGAHRIVLGGFGELVIEDLASATYDGVVHEGSGALTKHRAAPVARTKPDQ
jgi:hypothetical protein